MADSGRAWTQQEADLFFDTLRKLEPLIGPRDGMTAVDAGRALEKAYQLVGGVLKGFRFVPDGPVRPPDGGA